MLPLALESNPNRSRWLASKRDFQPTYPTQQAITTISRPSSTSSYVWRGVIGLVGWLALKCCLIIAIRAICDYLVTGLANWLVGLLANWQLADWLVLFGVGYLVGVGQMHGWFQSG